MDQKKLGVAITYVKMALSIIISLLFTPFLLGKLGDSEYGIYSLSFSLISFIALLDLGLGQTMIRYLSKAKALRNFIEEAQINGLFLLVYSGIAVIAVIIGIFLINIYPLIANKSLTQEEVYLFKVVFSILLIDTAASFPLSVFSSNIYANEKYLFLRGTDLVLFILKYAILIIVLSSGYKVVAYTIVITIISITMKIIYLFYSLKKLKVSFVFYGFKKDKMCEIFLYSFFILLNMIVDFLYNSTDKLILGAVAGTVAVTVYSFGIYFLSYFQQMSLAISGVFFPQIVRLYEKKHDLKGISDLFLRVGRIQMVILFLIMSGFIVLGREFIILWLGNSYGDAYIIGLLIMLPSIVPLTQNIGILVLRAMNIHKYRSYMYLAIALLNVVISIPLSIKFQGIGAAIGTVIATILGQIIFMNLFYKYKVKLDIDSYWKNFIWFVLPIIPLVVFSLMIKHFIEINNWYRFISFIFLYSFAYLLIYRFIIANEFEKELMRRFIKRIRGII